jgi:uncharacterized membrane protein YcaP (DUF421 family)
VAPQRGPSGRAVSDLRMLPIDWQEVFGFSVAPLEMLVRGTLMYWFLFLVFRVILRRNVGSVGIADILVLVIIADAAQNGMAGEYKSITDGCTLIASIVFWNYLVDWLSYRWPFLRKLLEPQPLLLIRDGQLLRHNMRKELIYEEELLAQLRQQGVEKPQEVKRAYMESDGTVTVIQRKKAE